MPCGSADFRAKPTDLASAPMPNTAWYQYVEHVVECFGFDRVMFGSDWPVCLLAGEYDRVFEALRTILAPVLNPASEAALWGNTAARFYKIF